MKISAVTPSSPQQAQSNKNLRPLTHQTTLNTASFTTKVLPFHFGYLQDGKAGFRGYWITPEIGKIDASYSGNKVGGLGSVDIHSSTN